MEDRRPKVYLYYNQLLEHLYGYNDNEFIYPRQFEIHLPANHKKACNLNCPHCAGKYFNKALGNWEMQGLELLDKLKGKIPYHVYGGAYTEPMMNPYFMAFLSMTKKYNNHFGIHTNGTFLNQLEENYGFLTELNRISTDDVDYLSISIDAGTPTSWGKTKGTTNIGLFDDEIIEGIKKACDLRDKSAGHAIRLCYLISDVNGNIEDFKAIIKIARECKVNSLRFSIPFGNYNKSFDTIRKYKHDVEIPGNKKYINLLEPFLSKSMGEIPYIFYTGPEYTDIDRYTFSKCMYGYYQITFGADGYVYRCSTVATPTGKQCRLGKVTADLDEFKKMVVKNQDTNWDFNKNCFAHRLRCNRMGLEINSFWE